MAVQSSKTELDSGIIDFSLKGIDGEMHSPGTYADSDALVIIFMCNHCPYVKAVVERFASLQEKYKDRSVKVIGINSNDAETYPEDSFENMKDFAEEYGLNFPYLVDDTQEVARAYDAACTPDIYVYSKDRRLKYRGRLDDNWRDEDNVSEKDLEKALELILEGNDADFDHIPSMGCSIKWKG